MALRLARTTAEAHVYMAMTTCEICGDSGYRPPNTGVIEVDGDLASHYAGPCPGCGMQREFTFRLPEEVILPDREEPVFGDEHPSELLDAGQWLSYADRITAGLPADPTAEMTDEQRRRARVRLLRGAAAVAEAIKFLPAGTDAVPEAALWSEPGQWLYATRPGRFDRRRLEVFHRACREAAERFGR